MSADSLYKKIKKVGLSRELESKILLELKGEQVHRLPDPFGEKRSDNSYSASPSSIYLYNDSSLLNSFSSLQVSISAQIRSLDDLLDRDKQREEDGFPRKIRVGRMIKPGSGNGDKVVVVPTTVEEKFIHDKVTQQYEEESAGGSGEGDEGEVIGEQPVRPEQGPGESGSGQGEGGAHDVESSAYELGRILTEKFELPNLKDKGKKRSLTKYTYDLTDKNRGFGQILDKKATLKRILKTNFELGKIEDVNDFDPAGFIIAPRDKVFRILSKEKDFESQAVVFFIRDYSGSMGGPPTELVVSQHVMLYSWLLYQYSRQVESRFILHDTEAKEAKDFHTYYNSSVAGGTKVASAYKLVNEIVSNESLDRDYNIYIFHGTDGDDWDTEGDSTIPELKKMLTFANRIGITIARNAYSRGTKSEVEKYIKKSGLLLKEKELLRLDVLQHDADEPRMIEGIKKLIS